MGSLFGSPKRVNNESASPYGSAARMNVDSYSRAQRGYNNQALITQKEGANNAINKADEVHHFREEQAVAYEGSGVLLQGSPLIMLEYTRYKGQQEVDAILARSKAESEYLVEKGVQVANEGRASLLGAEGSYITGKAQNEIQDAQSQGSFWDGLIGHGIKTAGSILANM